jgi:hypothetical protein
MSVSPCAPTTPVHGVVVFEPAVFVTQYPEFSTVPTAALQFNFTRATIQLNNSCGSRVCDALLRELLLNLLTAHITALMNGIGGQAPAGIVGRVSDATEGSVSVSADMGTVVYGQAYYNQTRWGVEYWAATARYRQAVYIPAPPRCYGPARGGLEGADDGLGPTGTGCGYNGGSA